MQKQPQTLRKSEANLPLVAIVGRTNVGKSSLFNRIAGRQLAIVQPEHGTTVDRIGTTIRHKSGSFRLMDTGGFSFEKEVLFRNEINREVEKAIHDAKIILFVCDGKGGIHPQDELFAQKLRTRKKQVIVVVNKLDHHELYSDADQFYKLGYDQLIKISTAQGQGIAELVDTIARKLPESSGSTQVDYD
ncbi:MAG: GTP-binding protein, partial [Candidatus Omnitrophica bacterium]|nr:GTP-binding protein [Candidatus Omnitrophota bacterium]